MSAETIWVTPAAAKLVAFMDQLALNAGQDKWNTDDPVARQTAQLGFQVTAVREAIRQGGKQALSQDTGTVPPDAEAHVYVLAINAMTASKPGLGNVVVGMGGGVYSPWNDLVKEAREWLAAVRRSYTDKDDITVVAPSWPMVAGSGTDLVLDSQIYDSTPKIAVTGLLIGKQYQWTPGANEVSLVCGSTTLTAAGSFYAIDSEATITGTVAGLTFTGSLQRAVSPVSIGSSTRLTNAQTLDWGSYNAVQDVNLGAL